MEYTIQLHTIRKIKICQSHLDSHHAQDCGDGYDGDGTFLVDVERVERLTEACGRAGRAMSRQELR